MNKHYVEKAVKFVTPILYHSRVYELARPFYSGLGQVLMFHRVVPESGKLRIHNHKSLEVSPQYLENLIHQFKKLDYDFISLDEMMALKDKPKREKKFVIFTFDDGYVDNYAFAYPIFKKHQIPFTIYVATNMPDGKAILWWYLLEDLVVNNPRIELLFDNERFDFVTNTVAEKEIAFNEIRNRMAMADAATLRKLLNSLFAERWDQVEAKAVELALSWDQIRELSKDPLVTIGSHTVNHLPLNSLVREDSEFEIKKSKEIIELQIRKEVKHFCYPIGSFGEKEIDILRNTRYASATTIKMANIFQQNLDQPFALPRIMINSLTNDQILKLQITGLLPALRNKFKRVIT
jgi:peptidoglycan/xylan/chitin deacetylase (PgdA/CDA1 family)